VNLFTVHNLYKARLDVGRVGCHLAMISGSLSPWHGASSGCGWRNGP